MSTIPGALQLNSHNEVNDDNRNDNETELHGTFKREAAALVTEQGYKISEAARSLDIDVNVLSRWRRQFEEEASGAHPSMDECGALKRLRKEVRTSRLEKEILKKASQYFAKEMK